jgi:alpha-D-xyloside xylohydrolase
MGAQRYGSQPAISPAFLGRFTMYLGRLGRPIARGFEPWLIGLSFFSHDIGGFIGWPAPELYIRWAQFGLFSSQSRCHGAGFANSCEPWLLGEEANGVFKQYVQLCYSPLLYIYDQARRCSRTAKSMVRAFIIDYLNDPNVRHIEHHYLFGDSLLVDPVLAPLDKRKNRAVYLPTGTWFDYGIRWPHESHGDSVDLQTMPIFVKDSSILPFGEDKQSAHNKIGRISRMESYGDEGRLAYDDGEKLVDVTLHRGRSRIEGLDYQPAVQHIGY